MNPPRPEARLCHREAGPGFAQHVIDRHADVAKNQLAVALDRLMGRGSSQRSRCAGEAKSCSSSMLPLSGALQLKTSAAQGTRPMHCAKGA